MTDRTDEVRARRAAPSDVVLAANGDPYRALVDMSPDAILVNRNGTIALVNPAAVRLFGATSPGQLLGTPTLDRFHPDCHELIRSRIRGLLEGRPAPMVDERILRLDGTTRDVEVTAAAVVDAAGVAIQVILRDIGERKRDEEKLRLFELIAHHTRDVVLFLRRDDGRIVEANAAAERMYGYGRDELLQLRIADLRAPGTEGRTAAQMAEADANGSLFETTHRRRDGTVFPVEVSSRGATIGDVRMLVSVVRDVAERRRTEAELALARERLVVAQEAGRIGTFDWDLEAGLVETAGMEGVYGPAGRDPRAAVESWRRRLHPDDAARVDRAIADALAGKAAYDVEYRVRRDDGSVLWVGARGVVVRDGDGRPVRMIGVNIDVTARRAAEDALREADRRKDEFLAILSHELRNPLAPIHNGLFVLERAAPGSDQARRALAVVRRQAGHLTRLVDDLLDVTRIARGKVELQRERVDLAAVVGRTVEDHLGAFEERQVRVDADLGGGPLPIEADATRIAQVVGNLLANAAKFTAAGGRVRVTLAREGAVAVLRVGDDGIGIEPAMLDRVFEPFTQAKQALDRGRGGLGLGLALVRGFVELHGGSVEVRSDGVGMGSEFTVRLPLADRVDGTERNESTAAGPGRRVLVIEDMPDAAASLLDALEFFGHEVRVAGSGGAGLACARAWRPDVVLCDIGLPDLDGYAVARAFRADDHLRPISLVALTGYALPEDRQRAREAGFDDHLAKPPDLAALERLIAGLPHGATPRLGN